MQKLIIFQCERNNSTLCLISLGFEEGLDSIKTINYNYFIKNTANMVVRVPIAEIKTPLF